ncbi:DUF1501 domain-containing protein [Prosthecobacter sp.]|uniref:DUF1501 domain-containing protein n=1 Tax=Prosthecobacter sp. TaxID=1965333 RepID=UPI003782E5C2
MNSPLLSRRDFLRRSSAGFGWLAFSSMAAESAAREAAGPLAVKSTHFPPTAKRVIFLCMRGGPSQMETFDPKPELTARHGQAGRVAKTKLLGSRWKFSKHGQSGIDVVELMPEIARHADKLCVLRGMATDNENHPQALEQLHTGSFQFVRPSMGAWAVHGLGTENASLPGFISINPLTALGGIRYYSSAFLPAACSATMLGNISQPGAPLTLGDISNPRLTSAAQRGQLDLLQAMNRDLFTKTADPRVEGLIESYELAFRMQGELPRVMDLSSETKATLQLYGADKPATESFGKQCLLARRFAEAGVRFIEITHTEWDLHGSLFSGMTRNCAQIDKPIAGLLQDLDQRGLLSDTLVLWGGEFGRSPDDASLDGRGHNNKGYSMWMAGGGVKAGHIHGATDELGYAAVDGRVHIHDLHATMLHLLGLDHERLTYRHGGRDFRLTDVKGRVVKEILA